MSQIFTTFLFSLVISPNLIFYYCILLFFADPPNLIFYYCNLFYFIVFYILLLYSIVKILLQLVVKLFSFYSSSLLICYVVTRMNGQRDQLQSFQTSSSFTAQKVIMVGHGRVQIKIWTIMAINIVVKS